MGRDLSSGSLKAASIQRAVVDSDSSLAVHLVEFLVVPTFVLDRDGKVMIWNKACADLTGVQSSEVLGTRDHWRAFYGEERPCLCDLVFADRLGEVSSYYADRWATEIRANGIYAENWCVMPRLGIERYLAINAGALHDASGQLVAVVETLRDMTSEKQAQFDLERIVNCDGLTGIMNRRGFDEALMSEWKRASRDGSELSLMMIDVDHFKSFNDKFGHQAGDACLRKISQSLSAAMRRPTDLLARYGGEEISAILPCTKLRGAVLVAERMLKFVSAIDTATIIRGVPAAVTVSIGVASMFPSRHQSCNELVDRADRALYQAKRDGRNRVTAYNPPPDAPLQR
jgi:diguanylate cyclase (GGDEF)-like protein/PAS domain S-box-containing protein